MELKALVARIKERGHKCVEMQIGALKLHEFPELGWRFSMGGHGKTQFAIQTQHLIDQLRTVEAVICAGCAGGLVDDVSTYDIVAATKTIEHDFRIKFFKRADPTFLGDQLMLKKLTALPDGLPLVHLGAIASGDEDILDKSRAAELRAQTGALAVAWEGAGGARACQFSRVPFLELRAITDAADEQAGKDFAGRLKLAMSNLGDVLLAAFA